jgi:hypothetical protein
MQFRLRTLLIVLALGPPVLAGAWFAVAAFATKPDTPPQADLDPRFEPGMFDSNRPQH